MPLVRAQSNSVARLSHKNFDESKNTGQAEARPDKTINARAQELGHSKLFGPEPFYGRPLPSWHNAQQRILRARP